MEISRKMDTDRPKKPGGRVISRSVTENYMTTEKTILLVDDDPNILQVAGFAVAKATFGQLLSQGQLSGQDCKLAKLVEVIPSLQLCNPDPTAPLRVPPSNHLEAILERNKQ